MNAWIENLPGPSLAKVVAEKGDVLKERYHTDEVWFTRVGVVTLVHIVVQSRVVLSFDDLEDWDYWSAYDAGDSPRDAAIEMLYDNGYAGAARSLRPLS